MQFKQSSRSDFGGDEPKPTPKKKKTGDGVHEFMKFYPAQLDKHQIRRMMQNAISCGNQQLEQAID